MESKYYFLLACVSLVMGNPLPRWSTYGVVDPIARSTCASFQSSYCNNIANGQGYSSGLFPNPLAPQYLNTPLAAQAAAEATFSIAVSTNCSQHIVQFLCFAYFPLCTSPSIPPVFPCKSMCERVRCECESALKSSGAATQWPAWLDCDDLWSVVTAYGAQSVCVEVEANDTCIASSAAPPTTSAPPSVVTPSSLPENDYHTCDIPCGDCSVRTAVTAATFSITNANYSFAAKVNVTNKYESIVNGCNLTLYDVTVLQQFSLCSVPAVTLMPLPLSSATITTNSDQCGDGCTDMVLGQVYWVAGMYGSLRGTPSWIIPRVKGVAAPWVAKYDDKGSTWLGTAMTQRGCSV